jgi:hypothetical protein
MSLTTALEAVLEEALREADAVTDDVLLSRGLGGVADSIITRHAVAPIRLRRVMFDAPHATRLAVAGDPGREEHRVVPGTAVELLVFADGVATMAMAAEGDDELEHAGVAVDTENDRIVVRYAAERPLAQVANRHAEEGLRLIEDRVAEVNKEVAAFNAKLDTSVRAKLEDRKALAQEREKFAAGLRLPESRERWWGRP